MTIPVPPPLGRYSIGTIARHLASRNTAAHRTAWPADQRLVVQRQRSSQAQGQGEAGGPQAQGQGEAGGPEAQGQGEAGGPVQVLTGTGLTLQR